MHTPDHAPHARQILLRGLTAGLLLTQTALVALGQTPAATNDAEKADKDKTIVLETLKVQAGFAGSLAAAAEIKQEQKIIAEVIAAEDIGKLPDVSIADALTRLTGLTTQRTNGRGQAISIRGLTGDFSTGLLNGREQVSTGLNRAVEFDQYPADLLNEVIVYKTAAPNLVGQGLAGTIDLRTVRPLSKSGRVVAVNGYYQWTELGSLTPGVKATGERANVSYIDQMDDGKMGIAIGFSHSSKPDVGQQFQAWGYPTDAAGNFALGGTKSYARNSSLNRDGIMLTIENRPSDNLHSTIDVFYSDFEEKQLLRGMEIPLAFWSSANLQPGYTTSNGLITSATLTNVQPVVRNDVFRRTDKPFSIGWNLEVGAKSAWPLNFDASFSRVNRNDQNLETYSGLGHRGTPFTTADTMKVQLIPGNIPVITSTMDYANGGILKLSDPQGWGPGTLPGGGMYGYLKYFRSKDELGQFQLSTRHELNKWFKQVEVGASYTDRYKRDGEGPSGFINTTGAVTLPLPAQVGTTDMGFLGLGRIYAFDPLASYDKGVWAFTANNDTGIVANRFDVEEKVTQFYVQGEIDDKWDTVPVRGNIGFRVIHTDQNSKGLSANGNNLNPVTSGETYTQFSPSLNLVFEPEPNTYVRFSAARQIARPRMYDLRASRSWGYDVTKAGSSSVNQSPWSGGGGNATLRPWVADSLDLSFEKYFKDSKGYIAVAGFAKKLQNFIYQQNDVADFSGYPVTAGTTPTLLTGVVSQPVNGDGGTIKGAEFTLQMSSELINDNIKGFGMKFGFAYTDSSIKPYGPNGGTAPIAGLSRKVADLTVYYERNGFSARISERYRSANRQYITTFGPPNPGGDVNPNGGFSMAQPETVVDAQVSYTFQHGPCKGLSIFVQAYNLNDEPLVTYNNDDPRQVINYQKYGATYSLGAAYKF